MRNEHCLNTEAEVDPKEKSVLSSSAVVVCVLSFFWPALAKAAKLLSVELRELLGEVQHRPRLLYVYSPPVEL